MIALNRSRQIILVSVFSVPVMVAIGAIGHLVSLDASVLKPLNVPSLEMGKTEPDAITSQVSVLPISKDGTFNGLSIDASKETKCPIAPIATMTGTENMETRII